MYDVFISHAWARDELGRCGHTRARQVAHYLRQRNLRVWIDHDCMGDDIDGSMADGIEQSRVVAVMLTRSYIGKVNGGSVMGRPNNCHKEFVYAHACQKPCIPMVCEPSLRSIGSWPPGIAKMYFASRLYVDASANDLEPAAKQLAGRIRKHLPPSVSILTSNRRRRARIHV